MLYEVITKQIISSDSFKCITGEFSKGEYAMIDKEVWNINKSNGKTDENYPFVTTIGNITPKKYKQLEETKGQVISNYQNEIEKQWIEKLKQKFNPIINLKALKYSKKK